MNRNTRSPTYSLFELREKSYITYSLFTITLPNKKRPSRVFLLLLVVCVVVEVALNKYNGSSLVAGAACQVTE